MFSWNLKYLISIFFVKTITEAIRLLGIGSGTNLPGRIARKLSPDILSFLVKQNKKEIISITGTNGKTSTAGLIASVFERFDRKVVHNKRGANMLNGITSSVIENSSFSGKLDSDNCVFEVDEAYMRLSVEEFNPDIVLVTNLFRDQLDRYGELNTTAKKIEVAIEKTSAIKPIKLILNADDPMVADIALDCSNEKVNRTFYGFEDVNINIDSDNEAYNPQESINCRCGKPYTYKKIFYGHLGYYECECGVKRPDPQVSAVADINVDYSLLHIKSDFIEDFTVKVNLPGLYNASNALAAIAVALQATVPIDAIKTGIENYSTTFGRAESLKLLGKDVIIQLIKNPVGATEVLKTIKNDKQGKFLILINDNYADGRDVSWLWDVNFELLAGYDKTAVISGTRASDMAVRLKYTGIPSENLIVNENIKDSLVKALNTTQDDEKLYVLPTYTALLELDKIKKSMNG